MVWPLSLAVATLTVASTVGAGIGMLLGGATPCASASDRLLPGAAHEARPAHEARAAHDVRPMAREKSEARPFGADGEPIGDSTDGSPMDVAERQPRSPMFTWNVASCESSR